MTQRRVPPRPPATPRIGLPEIRTKEPRMSLVTVLIIILLVLLIVAVASRL